MDLTQFIQELRRRKVWRVTAIYLVATWILLQVADVVVPAAGLPEWTVTLVLVLAGLGLPLVVVLAWALEVTPDGVKRTPGRRPEATVAESRTGGGSSGGPASRAGRRLAPYLGAAVLAVLVGFGVSTYVGGAPSDVGEGRRFASIAVLPFADMSPSGDHAWFSEGLSEELLNLLATAEGLNVAARTSSFGYGSDVTDIRTVGRDLDVEVVLEGSVRRSEDRLRITAQLIETATGYHLWSETYDRDDTDVFAIQDEIAAAIVEALGFGESLDLSTVERYTGNVVAYELYLQGRFEQRRIFEVPFEDGEAQALTSIALFERALALDSTYALAWAGIADTHTQYLADNFWAPLRAYPPGRDAALRALALDPDLSEAHVSLGLVKFWFNRDYEGAETSLRRATELDPDNASAHYYRSMAVGRLGRMGEAIEEAARAAALDSTRYGRKEEFLRLFERLSRGEEIVADTATDSLLLLSVLVEAGRGEAELEELLGRMVQEFPLPPASELNHPGEMQWLGYVAALLDRPAYTDSVLQTLIELREHRYVAADRIAALHAVRGRSDSAVVWLERAFEDRSAYLADGTLDRAWFNSLRGDPRFEWLQRQVRP